MFDLRKLEAFCKVCEQRSFSRAGEALFLSQPTVSAHIQSLERDLEVRLLDRMGRTVLPTPAGAVLYRYAKQAFARLETARAEINALASEVTGDLLVGSSSIPAHHVLPGVLTAFAETHPKVRPSLAIASSATIARQVLDGELMAGIVGNAVPPDPDLAATPLMDVEIVGIAPPDLPELEALSRKKETDAAVKSSGALRPQASLEPLLIPFEDACRLPWVHRESTSATRKEFENALRQAGHDARRLSPRLMVDSSHAAVQYVKAGLGVSVAARIVVREALDRGALRAFAVEGVRAERRFVCVTNARRALFPAAAVFQEFLLRHTRNLRPEPDADEPALP